MAYTWARLLWSIPRLSHVQWSVTNFESAFFFLLPLLGDVRISRRKSRHSVTSFTTSRIHWNVVFASFISWKLIEISTRMKLRYQRYTLYYSELTIVRSFKLLWIVQFLPLLILIINFDTFKDHSYSIILLFSHWNNVRIKKFRN